MKDIKEQGLNRVVVASCSPMLHERTFRRVCQKAGLNPYLFKMANIREHCSWVHKDGATEKAKALMRAAVMRVYHQQPLKAMEVPINPNTLVVGGGIAGIQAALDIANAGYKVYLVEQSPSIGGHMIQLDKTFPTLDCSACITTPKMSEIGSHANIELLTYSEVVEVSGYIGNFKVKIRKKARHVEESKCNGCGECIANCPVRYIPQPTEKKIKPPIMPRVNVGFDKSNPYIEVVREWNEKEMEIEIDGIKVKAREGMTILEAARGAGIDIPSLCYHRALTPL
ncbi:MAG: putative thiazole biosynthetic enzyme [Dehalococcoidia bacterium]|nr:putative thiazole biosynthetic enzyme [Bacillota bacterium]